MKNPPPVFNVYIFLYVATFFFTWCGLTRYKNSFNFFLPCVNEILLFFPTPGKKKIRHLNFSVFLTLLANFSNSLNINFKIYEYVIFLCAKTFKNCSLILSENFFSVFNSGITSSFLASVFTSLVFFFFIAPKVQQRTTFKIRVQ